MGKVNAILLLLLTSIKAINAFNDDYCWSNYVSPGYPCCKEGHYTKYSSDSNGDWGVTSGNQWCGIVYDRCKVVESTFGKKCCEYANVNVTNHRQDQDGIWGVHYDDAMEKELDRCYISESHETFLDRETIDETRTEWIKFKKNWENTYRFDFERLSVSPGTDETELNFAWYGQSKYDGYIRFGEITDDKIDYKTFPAKIELIGSRPTLLKNGTIVTNDYYSYKTTVTGIERNKKYQYQRMNGVKWEDPIPFNTLDSDNFNIFFFGDVQIGASAHHITASNGYSKDMSRSEAVRNDAFNWNDTISKIRTLTNKPSVILSLGDQVDTEHDHNVDSKETLIKHEQQFAGFLLPSLLQQVPTAVAVGNHEAWGDSIRYHFNVPNPLIRPSYISNFKGKDDWVDGYNYFFKYNSVLVVVLETSWSKCVDYKKNY